MKRFGLIGTFIGDSLSPRLFHAAYGGQYPYDLIDEPDFETAFRRFAEGDYVAVNVTAPFKEQAAAAADIVSKEVRDSGAANILVKTQDGLAAFNSDVLALAAMLGPMKPRTIAIVGYGGAGKAAHAAARGLGIVPTIVRHGALASAAVQADVCIFTLPKAVPGLENIRCRTLIEANYKTPCCSALEGSENYVGGKIWLTEQARLGYPLMTGEDIRTLPSL